MTRPHLSLSQVRMAYDGKQMFRPVSLDIKSGELVSIVGPSGCGKSTLLRLILGQESPQSGEILLKGRPLPDFPTPERGIVFQRYSAMPHMTVLGNVRLGLELKQAPLTGRLWFGAAAKRANDEAKHWVKAVGLEPVMHAYPYQLSGGMQQRLAIAQAMIAKPELLLLDEPFGALDPGIRAEMHELLNILWMDTQMTVIMVSHDLSEAFGLGTRVIVMDKPDPSRPADVTMDIPLIGKRERLDQKRYDYKREIENAPPTE